MNLMLAAISGETMLSLLIQLVVVGLIYWLLTWALATIAPPEPIAKIAKVLLILFLVVWLVNILLTFAGHPLIKF